MTKMTEMIDFAHESNVPNIGLRFSLIPSNEALRNWLSNERLDTFWDTLWLELWPFLY